MPPLPCGRQRPLDLGPALFVKCCLSPVSLFCFSQHQLLRKFPADPQCELQSDACPAWLQAAFQQGTLVLNPETGIVEVLYLALSKGDGRRQRWVGSDGAGEHCGKVPRSMNAAADSAKGACICLHGSLKSLACQSAGRLSALFLKWCPWRSLGWARGGHSC